MLGISGSIGMRVFQCKLILCDTVRGPEELGSESGLELLITHSVGVLWSPSEKEYQINLEK